MLLGIKKIIQNIEVLRKQYTKPDVDKRKMYLVDNSHVRETLRSENRYNDVYIKIHPHDIDLFVIVTFNK